MAKANARDTELVDKLRRGDQSAFRALVDEYQPQLLRVARLYTPTEAVAQEVVQEAWIGFLDGLERFEGRSSLKTYLFRILTNRAKTRGSRERRSVPFSATDDGDSAVEPERFNDKGMWRKPPTPFGISAPEELALNKEVRAILEAAISELSTQQGQVVTLRDIQGWSSAEVCELLDISEANQRVLLHRGRAKLRRHLESYFRDEPA